MEAENRCVAKLPTLSSTLKRYRIDPLCSGSETRQTHCKRDLAHWFAEWRWSTLRGIRGATLAGCVGGEGRCEVYRGREIARDEALNSGISKWNQLS